MPKIVKIRQLRWRSKLESCWADSKGLLQEFWSLIRREAAHRRSVAMLPCGRREDCAENRRFFSDYYCLGWAFVLKLVLEQAYTEGNLRLKAYLQWSTTSWEQRGMSSWRRRAMPGRRRRIRPRSLLYEVAQVLGALCWRHSSYGSRDEKIQHFKINKERGEEEMEVREMMTWHLARV